MRGVLFTDLDGTLLDADSYLPSDDALTAVHGLAANHIIAVPVTSKTAAEVSHFSQIIAFSKVAVAEGGAVIVRFQEPPRVIGTGRGRLVSVLHILQGEGWPLQGFSDMTTDDLCRAAGLDTDAARLAMDRRASEPFRLSSALPFALSVLEARVHELGGSITRGGRFWHLVGEGIDKGTAIPLILGHLGLAPDTPTGAVGDAWNDLPMLDRVDRGYLLGHLVPDQEVPSRIQRIEEQGPPGFVRAAAEFEGFCRRNTPTV